MEKPFGHDLASARLLNDELTRYADEQQVCRIDHYLGKETVQNILMFRFSNSIFEQLWNRKSIDHVQITVSEKLGVGGARRLLRGSRGRCATWCKTTCCRCWPWRRWSRRCRWNAEAIRDEKVKLLKSIRPLTRGGRGEAGGARAVFAGAIDGREGGRVTGRNRRSSRIPTWRPTLR